ncbi:MAG: hypothetical protein PVI70_13050 [Gammaproteobacteria bacterium]|jgi:hypothetical protein
MRIHHLYVRAVAILFVCISSTPAFADQVASFSFGEFRLGGATFSGDPNGLLVSCSAGQIVTEVVESYTYLEGICDDSGSLPACAGRFTSLTEACAVPGAGVVSNDVGNLRVNNSRTKFRVCFDSSGVMDCRDPNALVIAEGDTFIQHSLRIDGKVSIAEGQSTVAASVPFTADGMEFELDRGPFVTRSFAEVDLVGTCYGNPSVQCGISTISYRDNSKAENKDKSK